MRDDLSTPAPAQDMTPLQGALYMIGRGFRVFPLKPELKDPYGKEDREKGASKELCGGIHIASRNIDKVRRWFEIEPRLNYGYSTNGRVGLDADVADGKPGIDTLIELGPLPHTLCIGSARGGLHTLFGEHECGQADLGPGLNVRSKGGYLVGPGCVFHGKKYRIVVDAPVAPCPDFLKEMLSKVRERAADNTTPLAEETESAIAWGVEFLSNEPGAEQGERNNRLFALACILKDKALSEATIVDLLMEHWCPRCTPPYDEEGRVARTVRSAFDNGKKPPGVDAPEAELDDISDTPELQQLAATAAPPKKVDEHFEWPDVTDKGKVKASSLANVYYLIEKLGTSVRFNEFTNLPEIETRSGFVELTDVRLNKLWAKAQLKGFPVSFDSLARLVTVVADAQKFHPVRRYLDALKWDGHSRADTWLSTYLGADASELNAAFGRSLLFGAVRRILHPGCKHDSMLVLEGKQGSLKSSAVAVLGGQFFGDGLRLGLGAKETIEQTRGLWLIEIAELAGMGNKEVEAVKHQISCQMDRARMAFGRLTLAVPRQCVFVGTTNSDRYLKDPTGNRRFCPVRVGKIDLPALIRDRDQLWAEAYFRATVNDESPNIPEPLWAEAAAAQDGRRVINPIEERLSELLDGVEGVIPKEQIWLALGRSDAAAVRQQREMNDLTDAMKKLGWKPEQRRAPRGKRVYVYVKPVLGPEPVWLEFCEGEFLSSTEATRRRSEFPIINP